MHKKSDGVSRRRGLALIIKVRFYLHNNNNNNNNNNELPAFTYNNNELPSQQQQQQRTTRIYWSALLQLGGNGLGVMSSLFASRLLRPPTEETRATLLRAFYPFILPETLLYKVYFAGGCRVVERLSGWPRLAIK